MVVAAVLAFGVSGCEKKAEGQTVAVVNGEEITAAELNAEIQGTQLPAGLDKDAARARILQGMVDRRLLAQQARSEGLDKSPEYLNRQRKMNEELLINMLVSRQLNTAQVPSARELAQLEAQRPQVFRNREQWDLAQVRFTMPTDAKVRQAVGEAKSMDALVAILEQNNIAFTRAKTRLDTAVVPSEIYARISSLAPGEPFVIPVGEQAVASVIASREQAPLTGEQARPTAVALLRREQAGKAMQDRLKALRGSAKIEYQKGYAPPKDGAAATPALPPAS